MNRKKTIFKAVDTVDQHQLEFTSLFQQKTRQSKESPMPKVCPPAAELTLSTEEAEKRQRTTRIQQSTAKDAKYNEKTLSAPTLPHKPEMMSLSAKQAVKRF